MQTGKIILNGYWTVPVATPRSVVDDAMRVLDEHLQSGKPLLVSKGVEYHPFETTNATPDALCRYCWSPNLHTSTHCEKCGAPLIRVIP